MLWKYRSLQKKSHNPLTSSVFLAMYLHFPQKSPVQESILLFEWITIGFINVVDVTSYIVNLSCSPIKFPLQWISNRNVFSKYAKIFHYMINRSQYTHSNCSPNPGSMNNTIWIKSFLLYTPDMHVVSLVIAVVVKLVLPPKKLYLGFRNFIFWD